MGSIWKPLAIISLAAAAALTALLLGVSFRDNPKTSLMRRNVEEQIRYHLAQKEPAKAAALLATYGHDLLEPFQENALRLETARASSWEQASKILDELILPAMDREQAAETAQTRLDLQRRLFESSVLVDGALPAPFEPQAFLMGKPSAPPVDEMRRITAKLVALVTERRDLARRHGSAADPELDRIESLAIAARYALGELPFEALKIDHPEVRILVGDLLFRERQFDRALATWTPVLGDLRVVRRVAELAALRRYAPKELRVWDYDVEKHLGKDPALEARVMESVQAIFKGSRPGELSTVPIRKGIPRDDAGISPGDEPAIFFPEASPENAPLRAEPAVDPNQIYLLVNHRQFDFKNVYDRPFMTRADPQLRLHSSYTGPIRFRLLKVRDLAVLVALDATSISAKRAELELVREWQKEFTPIGPNGKLDGDWLVEVPACPAGLYVLMADARYCPVYAFARLIVTDTGLLQQPALDRVLVHSVDRVTGSPVPGMELAGEVTGRYVLKPAELLPRDDSNAEEFRRGFDAAWAAKPSEPDATPSYLRGYQEATTLRADRPDVRTEFKGTTDKDGLFEWTVTPAWREGYQYVIRTTSTQGGTCTRVESTYSVQGEGSLQTLVYADRPLYRCGESVSFKALIRRRDGEGLQPYNGRDALIEIGTGERVLYARTHPVTDFGTASGTLDLPEECARAPYWVRINNGSPQQLFKVEDYHKAEFEISFIHPRTLRAGDAIDVAIQVRHFSGEPLVKLPVTVTVQSAAAAAPVHLVDEWGGVALPSPNSSWRSVEERVVSTDEEGRCLFRFQSEEGVAARYVVTASAIEHSRREVSRRTSFEASAQTRQVVVETDRPIYYPGEIAKVRFRLADAATARIEERAKVEKPFATTVALQDGAGSVEYPVPDSDRNLQIAVREGPGWSWTTVPIRIKPRTTASSFVHVRLDRPFYRVGETAKVEITSSEPNASVLLVVATGKIHRRQVVRLTDRRIEVPLQVRDEDIPNVHVLALSVKNDHVGRAAAELNVPPLDRFLTVEISTDLPEYGPGQECKATLRVTDSQGRPVPECELSLGVIDESVYALQQDLTPDLREHFHRYARPLRVQESFFYKEYLPPFSVWKCPVFVRGQMNFYDAMGMGVGGGGGGRYGGRFGGRENMVARGGGTMGTSRGQARTDFRDTAYWNAHLKTGADGTATASFAFPENLTRFRFTARGITRAHQVGEVRQETVVRKPFFVTIAAPRVVQEGNSIAVCGIVHNGTDKPQVARVFFKTPFPTTGSTAPAQLSLAPGDARKVEVLLSIDQYLADAPITFGAECDSGESDAMTIRVPGRRHGSPFLEGRSGSVAGGTPREEVFRIPAGAIPGTLSLTVEFDAGIHTAIAGALDPLVDYPYGCVEQTMSRFLPAVAAKRALGDVPPRLRQRLPSVISAGLQRLYSLQQRDGSWGWWADASPDAPLTAYVLYGLAICKKAGVGVDKSVADLAAKHLSERLAKSVFTEHAINSSRLPLRTSMDLRVYELLALAEYHSAWGVPAVRVRQLIGTMADRRDRLGPVDEIVLALAATRIGMNEVAGPLAQRATRRLPDDVAATSFYLQLQAARGADLAPAVRLLLARRTGKGWANTIESAHALLGLAAAVERPNPAMDLPPGRVEVHVNGEVVQELTLRGAADASFDGRVTIPAPAAGWGEKAVVRLVYDGQGSAFYTASLEAALGGENRAPVSRGIQIRREYYEMDADGKGWHPVEGTIAAGNPVLVVLKIDAGARRDYLMVTDPRPDGFEPLDIPMTQLNYRWSAVTGLSDRVDLARGWEVRLDAFRRTVRGDPARESSWAKSLLREIIVQRRFAPVLQEGGSALPAPVLPVHVEHRDDRTIFFLDSMDRGPQCLWYFARAELAGATHALPPRIEAMYEPEIHATGAEAQLDVADGRLIPTAARTHLLAPGVEGLLEVLPHLAAVDADALIDRIPANPTIGDLLISVCTEPALRAWLSAAPATSAADRDLRERIDAGRRDLETRMLCVGSLDRAPKEWLPALDAALGDDGLTARVLREADPADLAAIDNILLWSSEERAYRLSLLAAAQSLRNTAHVEVPSFPRVDLPRIATALGARAPAGPALLAWKLGQRGRIAGGSLKDLADVCERDLGLKLRVLGDDNPNLVTGDRTISEILDVTLPPAKLYYRIRDGQIVVGSLEELLR